MQSNQLPQKKHISNWIILLHISKYKHRCAFWHGPYAFVQMLELPFCQVGAFWSGFCHNVLLAVLIFSFLPDVSVFLFFLIIDNEFPKDYKKPYKFIWTRGEVPMEVALPLICSARLLQFLYRVKINQIEWKLRTQILVLTKKKLM